MSFLIIGGERYALEYGATTLGGGGENAVQCDALATLPAVAIIDYPVMGSSTIRRLGSAAVTLNGAVLAEDEQPLQHGDRIVAAGVEIVYGEMRAAGGTNRPRSDAGGDAAASGLDALGESPPTAPTGGRLVRRADGAVIMVPEEGLTIGRDPASGLPLTSRDASRLHAIVMPTLLGYTLVDRSTNGVWVNGRRVEEQRVLGQHDLIRIGGEELRFEADEATFDPPVSQRAPATGPAPGDSAPAPRPRTQPPLLAVLEVVSRGPLESVRFRIERSTVQVGRAPHNDVVIRNESVSGSHASLVLRDRTWHVVDLGSRNGTFVDGEIVKEQRTLPQVCSLRLGTLELVFRAIGTPQADPQGTIAVIGLTDREQE